MRSASVAVAFLLPFTFARPAHDRRSAVSSTAISSKSASSAAHISSSAHSSSSSAVRLSLKASSSSSHASSSSKATSSAKSTSAPASSKSSAKSSSASSSKSSTASKSSASSSKAASSSASAPVATSTKKGLGFNTASYTNNFNLAWAYDWSSRVDATTGKLNAGVEYVPMLWNTVNTTWNADASAAIKAGSTHLLGFNEPDLNTQSNITPSDAAAAWLQNIEPFHTQVKLISPAITNGGPPMGITWMSEFLGNCTTCHVDAIAAHWYDSATNFGYFTNYFTDMYKTFGKPIWITEFAGYGTVQQQQDFFNYIIPWMENQTFIERYAAFGDFSGTFVNSNGSLTPLGHTYNTVI